MWADSGIEGIYCLFQNTVLVGAVHLNMLNYIETFRDKEIKLSALCCKDFIIPDKVKGNKIDM